MFRQRLQDLKRGFKVFNGIASACILERVGENISAADMKDIMLIPLREMP